MNQALQAFIYSSARWAGTGALAVLCAACVAPPEYSSAYGGYGSGYNSSVSTTTIYGAQPAYPVYLQDRGDWVARERERERMQREREYEQQMRERERQARERDQWQRQLERERNQQQREQQFMQDQQRREWERQQAQNRRDQDQMRRDQERERQQQMQQNRVRDQERALPTREWTRQWRVSPNKQQEGD